jgi:hypothetical protein
MEKSGKRAQPAAALPSVVAGPVARAQLFRDPQHGDGETQIARAMPGVSPWQLRVRSIIPDLPPPLTAKELSCIQPN